MIIHCILLAAGLSRRFGSNSCSSAGGQAAVPAHAGQAPPACAPERRSVPALPGQPLAGGAESGRASGWTVLEHPTANGAAFLFSSAWASGGAGTGRTGGQLRFFRL